MDFTLDQITSPFFPFPFPLDGTVWSSVAQYAYVKSLPSDFKRGQLFDLFERNNETPRPWISLGLHHTWLQMMRACFQEWLLTELDLFWTRLFNADEDARRRLQDTGDAILCIPELEGSADILMLHRSQLATPTNVQREKAQILTLLTRDFLLHPHMAQMSYEKLTQKYRHLPPPPADEVNIHDPILLRPDNMVEALKKRHLRRLRDEQAKELACSTGRLMFAFTLRSLGKSLPAAEAIVRRESEDDLLQAGRELLTTLRHTLPATILAKIEEREKTMITDEEVEQAEAVEETSCVDARDPMFVHEMSIDVAAPLADIMNTAVAHNEFNCITLYVGDPLLPSPPILKSMMEFILREHGGSEKYRPMLTDWEEGFRILTDLVQAEFVAAFDRASCIKWRVPSFRAFQMRNPVKLYPTNANSFFWAGHLIEHHLGNVHKAYPMPTSRDLYTYNHRLVVWNAASFLTDPLLRAVLRLKTSWLGEILRLYLPKDVMGRRLPDLIEGLSTEAAVFSAIFCPVAAASDQPDPAILAYIQKFAQGYDGLAIFRTLDFFISRANTPLTTAAQWCAFIVRCTFLLGRNHHLDDIMSKIGIDFLFRHSYMVPAYSLEFPPQQLVIPGSEEKWSAFNWDNFWKTARPATRAFILAVALDERGPLVEKLKTSDKFRLV